MEMTATFTGADQTSHPMKELGKKTRLLSVVQTTFIKHVVPGLIADTVEKIVPSLVFTQCLRF